MRVSSKRGKDARYKKKYKTQYFKFLDPYSNDKLLRKRAETLSGDTDLRYKQGTKPRKPQIPKKNLKNKEENILEKETKKIKAKSKKKK